MKTPPVLTPGQMAGSPLLDLGSDALPVAPVVLVDVTQPAPPGAAAAAGACAAVVVGIADGAVHPTARDLCAAATLTLVTRPEDSPAEVHVADLADAAELLQVQAASAPRAASVLVDLLRITERLDVQAGLHAESLAYSLLLAGPEFAAWRRSTPVRDAAPDPRPPVRIERDADLLHVVLDRPHRHNAYSRHVRDALVEALQVALVDPGLRVLLRGEGASFCSGGDLDEFGSNTDVVAAHRVRTGRSAGLLLHHLADRTKVDLHGACIGAGLELACFAGDVVAAADSHLRLPELGMGLVPGAGGTVSCTRRVGRWRTAWLVLSGLPLPVDTARRWGLIDRQVSPIGGPAHGADECPK